MAVVSGRIDEFVSALAAQDFARLAEQLADDVEFRAAVPSEQQPFREKLGRVDAAEQLRAWFGDADELELLASSIERMPEVTRMTYRFGAHEEGAWYVVEQQAYARLNGDGRIARLDLVCTGFQAVPERPKLD